MREWKTKRLDIFLNADELPILDNQGNVSFAAAKQHAESEFEKYRVVQDRLFESDFDKQVKEIIMAVYRVKGRD